MMPSPLCLQSSAYDALHSPHYVHGSSACMYTDIDAAFVTLDISY